MFLFYRGKAKWLPPNSWHVTHTIILNKNRRHLRRQHYGNGIIEDAFAKEKGIQLNIDLEFMEYGKDSHWQIEK